MRDPNGIKEFLDMTIEEIFADRFSRYSKYIIQERALPDVRDGLKPVQRRILFSMHKEGNTFHKQFRKSAKTVGNVIGNYHPHGDVSVYEAMVRMSQDWKVNKQLVIMHGNNGSIDGDSAAAMRYTEAKLSEYAELLTKNIKEDTVRMVPNFDDTELEPTVMPTRVPNLLINGSSGISAGYATDIPPHNPTEVIDATIHLNQNRECTLDDLMQFIKGPDFPTGATAQGIDGIRQAYETGRGKISIRSDFHFDKNSIIITAIPYDVNKSILLQRIDLIRAEKKIQGISEVLDQSDQKIMEIAIVCKKDGNKEAIINYLLKNTDLQKSYSFNMIAIANRKPMMLGIKGMLQGFLDHREEVITRRSEFRLEKANVRIHLVEGLIKAVDVMDKIIKIIRNSKDKASSRQNIMDEFDFSQLQAEAIVMMQLYKLSNTDVTILIEEQEELLEEIIILEKILNVREVLIDLITTELREAKEYTKRDRFTKIEDEIEKFSINPKDLIKPENMVVSISKSGYIKRSTTRSYLASNQLSSTISGDSIVENFISNTRHNTLVFFNDGTYVIVPTIDIPETKWKDVGKHISTFCKINDGVEVVGALSTSNFKDFDQIITATVEGYVSRVLFNEFNVNKFKQKILWHKLKAGDKVKGISFKEIEGLGIAEANKLLILTNKDRHIVLNCEDVTSYNIKRLGKRYFKLREGEKILGISVFSDTISLFTDKGGYFHINNLTCAEKPTALYSNTKSNPHNVIKIIADLDYDILVANEDELIIPFSELAKSKYGERFKQLSKNIACSNIEKIIKV